ncbi:DDE_3 domain-containing protein [Trichonephila clavipes]|nr:DDE_3 domain-containing protein [Trichonephila clavipes]
MCVSRRAPGGVYRFSWPANSPDLYPIENLWDHLYRVVLTMDSLAQLATALESAWLNIPVNTFRNLIDFARLAAVHSTKGCCSGF